MIERLARFAPLEFVYEAGPCGYQLHREMATLGQPCTVIAPGLTPQKPGDKVKTDRRDAEKLAQLHRAGQLTPIRVPTREEESARDLTRVREDVLVDRLRARHRLSKFLLRQGLIWRETKAWSASHREWLSQQRFAFAALQGTFESYLRAVEEAEARLADLDRQVLDLAEHPTWKELVRRLRCLKGIDTLSALTLAVEVQDFRRFSGRGNSWATRAWSAARIVQPTAFIAAGSRRSGTCTCVGSSWKRRGTIVAVTTRGRR